MRATRHCLICNQVFYAIPSSDQKYCSRECYATSIIGRSSYRKGLSAIQEYGEEKAISIKAKSSKSKTGKLHLPRSKKKCELCGKEFEGIKTNRKFIKKRFCSYKCSNSYNAHKKFLHVKIICKGCGKEFESLESWGRTYCSIDCAFKNVDRSKGPEQREKLSIATTELMKDEINREKVSKGLIKYYEDHPEAREIIGKQSVERWKDPEYAKKCLVCNKRNKNKTEMEIDKFLKTEFPNELEYVGDGKVSIEGKIPDWISKNGYKIIVELYGNHWHTEEEAKERIKFFAKYGYKTLIIWASEFYHNKKSVKAKVLDLMKDCQK